MCPLQMTQLGGSRAHVFFFSCLTPPACSCLPCSAPPLPYLQVSFGVFEGEEDAARQYDRALILEKGRAAKTNFPIRDYEGEAAEYEALLLRT